MKKVILKDDDGHKFRLTVEEAADFTARLESIRKAPARSDLWYDLLAEFNNLFEEKMIG